MPTTDKNGVVQLQTSDLIAPFQTTVNSVSGSISNVLTTLKKDIIYKATNQNDAITKKNALIEQGIVGTPNAPLLFYFTNINTMYEWDGSSWNRIAPEPNNIVVIKGHTVTVNGGSFNNQRITWPSRGTVPTAFTGYMSGSNALRGSVSVNNLAVDGCTLRVDNMGAQSSTVVPVVMLHWVEP